MRIAISSSDTNNPYAALLAQALAMAGHTPVGFLINPTSRPQALVRYAKYYGWYHTWRRILHPPAHTTGEMFYIEDYLGGHNIQTKHLSVDQVANDYGIRKIHGRFTGLTLRKFVKNNVDVIINAGGGIFPKSLIHAPRLGIINIHLGALPEFRGVHTFEWSLWYDKPLEITIHWIAEGLDTGDILATKRFMPKLPTTISGMKSQSIEPRTDLLIETIKGLDEGKLSARPQPQDVGKQYYAMHEELQSIVAKKLS